MKSKITTKTVQNVSDLIKIHLTDDELEKMTAQLNTVLEAMDVLNEINTDNVEPTTQTHGLTNVLAEDEVEPSLDMKNYKNTKNFKNGYFMVEKVL